MWLLRHRAADSSAPGRGLLEKALAALFFGVADGVNRADHQGESGLSGRGSAQNSDSASRSRRSAGSSAET